MIVVVGSIAYDSIKTEKGSKDRIIGGSVSHFCMASSLLSKPYIVGVVGKDFVSSLEVLKEKASSIDGIEIKDGKTFFWKGRYEGDMNTAITEETQLNVFESFSPDIPQSYKGADILFLANIDPELQIDVIEKMPNVGLKIADTMNLWINTKRESVDRCFNMVDIAIINEGEAFLLTGKHNILTGAREIIDKYRLKLVIVKKGSNGVMAISEDTLVNIPAYPIESIVDPTGAGDSFAGGFVSYIDKVMDSNGDIYNNIKNAIVYASVVASFNVEGFGIEATYNLTIDNVKERLKRFADISSFDVGNIL